MDHGGDRGGRLCRGRRADGDGNPPASRCRRKSSCRSPAISSPPAGSACGAWRWPAPSAATSARPWPTGSAPRAGGASWTAGELGAARPRRPAARRTLLRPLRHPAVLIGRLLPVVRTFIALPAGMARMRQLPFHIYTFVGSWWCSRWPISASSSAKRWDSDPRLQAVLHRFDLLVVAAVLAAAGWFVCAQAAPPPGLPFSRRGPRPWPSARHFSPSR